MLLVTQFSCKVCEVDKAENNFPLNCLLNSYGGWLNFRGVPIFVVFVEVPHKFKYPRISDFLYEL